MFAVEEKTIDADIFPLAMWRDCGQVACEQTALSLGLDHLDVMTPFNFEVLNDRAFLTKQLRRFYCFLGVQNDALSADDCYKISNEFRNNLVDTLQEKMPELLEDVVLFIENRKIFPLKQQGYICRPTDKLIDIQVRRIKTTIIDDYSNYLIANVVGLLEGRGECGDFYHHTVKRSRTFQIYVVLEAIFSFLLKPLSREQTLLMKIVHNSIHNGIQPFYKMRLMHSQPTLSEADAYEKLVLPRVNEMYQAINIANDKTNITIDCYHIPDTIHMTLDTNAYQTAMLYIKDTYLRFAD